jgi:hypothetical protein
MLNQRCDHATKRKQTLVDEACLTCTHVDGTTPTNILRVRMEYGLGTGICTFRCVQRQGHCHTSLPARSTRLRRPTLSISSPSGVTSLTWTIRVNTQCERDDTAFIRVSAVLRFSCGGRGSSRLVDLPNPDMETTSRRSGMDCASHLGFVNHIVDLLRRVDNDLFTVVDTHAERRVLI